MSVSVLIVLAALSPFVPAGQTILTFYTDPIVCEFALGLLVGAVFTAKVNVRPSVAWSALIVGFLLIVAADALFDLREVQRSLKWGIPAGLIVFGSVMLERERSIPTSRLLLAIGNASYSIYLTHFMTLALLARTVAGTRNAHAGLRHGAVYDRIVHGLRRRGLCCLSASRASDPAILRGSPKAGEGVIRAIPLPGPTATPPCDCVAWRARVRACSVF